VAEDFRDQISVQKRLGEEALPEIDVTPPHPAFLTPMADVLASDASNDEKRMAIEGLARLETPQSVEVLRKILSTGSTEVRFYAASVLEGLEERLTERLMTLERDVASGRRRGPGTELEIARTFLDYAYYRVALGPRRLEYLEQAARHGGRAREHGSDPEAHLVEGRALLLLGRAEAAEECFSRYVRTALHRGKALVWRAEARFRLGRYEEAATDCQHALAEGTVPAAVREAVETWAALAPGGTGSTEATEAA
jgi:tetratricopeptide (TPR) repeat protein